jgi:AcrR family transcriptional regulator
MMSETTASTTRRKTTVESAATPGDKRAQRRIARHEQSRAEILDAAEQVFGQHGPRNGSLRRIAELSGFSPAGIYLFFENKQDLLAQTLSRRGDEWIDQVREVTRVDADPMEMLHRIIDLAIEFFARYPYFRLLMRHIDRGATLSEPGREVEGHYHEVVTHIAGIIERGQEVGLIRSGGAPSLAHLFSVLVNEFVLLDGVEGEMQGDALSAEEFHEVVDGAFRLTSTPIVST